MIFTTHGRLVHVGQGLLCTAVYQISIDFQLPFPRISTRFPPPCPTRTLQGIHSNNNILIHASLPSCLPSLVHLFSLGHLGLASPRS